MPGDALLDEIIERLTAVVPDHSKIVLFGSRARGVQRVTSDVDVMVIEPAVDDPMRESVRLRSALNGVGVPIDIVVLARGEADRRAAVRGTVVERALREGLVLVDA